MKTLLTGTLVLGLLLPNTSELGAQKSEVERAGDVLQVAIPALAFAGTVGLHDFDGTTQFLKSFLTTVAATGALKLTIARKRPDGSNDNSFPSGHTSAAFQGASFIHLRYGWAKGLPAYAGATFVGFSRVYADKHYVSDVVAGAALGTLSSLLFTDRFGSVEVIPATDGGRFGVEMRLVVGF
ncbi:MAG: phosphatase PAP2 family protein [Longimicrobiales bacterium]|nr:phosphatase PAP2 family protein [Longimicrobiales bacterium]